MDEEKKERKFYTVSELLRYSFSIIKSNIKILLEIVLVFIVLGLINNFLPPNGMTNAGSSVYFISWIISIIFVIISIIASIALISATNNLIEGNPITTGESFSVGYKMLLSYLWVSILVGLVECFCFNTKQTVSKGELVVCLGSIPCLQYSLWIGNLRSFWYSLCYFTLYRQDASKVYKRFNDYTRRNRYDTISGSRSSYV